MGKSEFKVDWKKYEAAQIEDAGTSIEYLKANKGIWEKREEPKGWTEFKTPSKKIELYSTVLEKEGYEPAPTWHYRFAHPTNEYPYYILTEHLPWRRMGINSNDPLLVELFLENLLHMHPDTAARIGVKEGEYVFVESPTGKNLKIRAYITRGIRRDCVMTEHGFGYWSKMLRVGYGKGSCDGDLLPERSEEDTLKTSKYNAAMGGLLLDVGVNVRKA